MEENTEVKTEAEIAAPTGGNFNDNLHGENLTERAKVLSPSATVAKRFFRSKLSVIGLTALIVLFLFSFIGPLFSPWKANGGTAKDYDTIVPIGTYKAFEYTGPDGQVYEAYDIVIDDNLLPYNSLGQPSGKHWLGTDKEGNDVLTRLMYGGRV